MNRIFFLVPTLALAVSGCVRLPCGSSREPQQLSHELTHALSYEKMTEFQETNAFIAATSAYSARRFVLALPRRDRSGNKTVAFRLFCPVAKTPAASVIILPLSSGSSYLVEEYLARDLVRNGIAALVVERERVGASIADGARLNELLQQSVLDGKHLVDWLAARRECDASRIGVLGVSLGAIRGALLLAADERVKAGVLGLVGGTLSDILTHSTDGAWRGGGITRRREAYLKEHRMRLGDFRRELAQTIQWDPVRVAPALDPRRVRLVLGLCDTVVPFRTGLALRRAMGKPEMDIVLAGHYGAVLYLPWISRESVMFFQRKFALP